VRYIEGTEYGRVGTLDHKRVYNPNLSFINKFATPWCAHGGLNPAPLPENHPWKKLTIKKVLKPIVKTSLGAFALDLILLLNNEEPDDRVKRIIVIDVEDRRWDETEAEVLKAVRTALIRKYKKKGRVAEVIVPLKRSYGQ
jgi:hypothetical protein